MSMKLGRCRILILLLCLPVWGSAEIYRWVDDQGRVHFGDAPREAAAAEKVEVRVQTISTVKVDYLPEWETRDAPRQQRVVMYSTQWCKVCVRAKQYFREKNIAFVEKDIEASTEARQEFDRLGGKGVPLILVGKQRMSGFSPGRMEQMLAAR